LTAHIVTPKSAFLLSLRPSDVNTHSAAQDYHNVRKHNRWPWTVFRRVAVSVSVLTPWR